MGIYRRSMKLLTHNMLTSKCMKAVTTGYPLAIQARDVKVSEVEFNQDFIARVTPENYEGDMDFLRKAHHALLEIEVINGDLVCPETSRKFPVTDGIPNMLLNEDEI